MAENNLLNKEKIPEPNLVETVELEKQVVADTKSEQKMESPEQHTETTAEDNGGSENVNTVSATSLPSVQAVVVPEVKSELRQAVERIMESDLKDLYLTMSPAERQAFKKKGEEAAKEITGLIEKTKINLSRVLKILFEWLRLIPGVDKFFLEQESKLKADQLLKLPK